ncbi:uncharacterized protein [Amphiura filiformis]|uniref:uncharacterized protein n=1 Tax=Amphiura filiformis TaxID=82378 RepID=UPI003B228A25
MVTANGQAIDCLGKAKFKLKVNDTDTYHEIWVADINEEGILGFDFLKTHQCVLDFAECSLLLNELPSSPYDEDEENETYLCQIAVNKATIIPAESEALISTKLVNKPNSSSSTLEVETLGLVEPTWSFIESEQMMVAKTLIDSSTEEVVLRVINPHNEPRQMYEGMIIATVEPIEEIIDQPETVQCNSISVDEESENKEEIIPKSTSESELPEYLQDLWERSKQNLSKVEQESLQKLLIKYKHVFAKSKTDLGRTNLVKHHIDTGDAPPVKMPSRRLPMHQREEEKVQVETMLEQNIIEPSNSPWRSSVVLVRKKDGSYRWCVDFRGVNAVTRKDSYALPRIDDTLDRLSGSKWFSTLDLQSGYWQVEMDAKAKTKRAS